MVINPEGSAEPGLNQNAVSDYGDDSSASAAKSSNGFTITNSDDAPHGFTLSYSKSGSDGTMMFAVAYDESGDGTVGTLVTVDSGTSQTLTLQAGETAYVVVSVDTTGGTTNIDGTFSIDAA